MTTGTLKFGFGPFQLLPVQRTLLHDNQPVPLGGRAFDILTLLLERAGEVVSKEDLIAHAWPRTFVEESNLRVHVSALRKALGESASGHRYIENVAGRGYSFVAPVALLDGEIAARSLAAAAPILAGTRRQPLRVIGRGEVLAAIGAELRERRLLTVVGPGGIGKTTVAGALAERVGARFADGVATLDLTVIADPLLVPGALAATLCVPMMSNDPLAGIRLHLRRRELLLVLDNCDHLADTVVELADELLACAPGLRILATSREAIGLPYERVFRLPPLAVPGEHLPQGGAALADFSALALFAERAAGSANAGRLRPDDVGLVARICRRLDGMPLSIELVAARAEALGLRTLACGLDDCLALLSRKRRGNPHYQTLRGVLDWSYAQLAPAEQRMLRCLSVYRSDFTVDCARAASAASAGGQPFDAELLFTLATRSLLACEYDGSEVRYRMLETTRRYAAARLEHAPEHHAVRRAHALRCLDLLAEAERDCEMLDGQRWQARYGRRVADLRAALDWCFGSGDPELGVRLTTASSLLWIELSLLDEQRLAILRALRWARDPAAEMALRAGLGNALYHLNGPREQTTAAFARAYELARALGNGAELARAYSGLCAVFLLDGSYPQAQALGHVFAPYRHRSPEPVAHVIYDRMMALTLHFSGQQRQARFHAERVYRAPLSVQRTTRSTGVPCDQQVVAATVLARIRWVEGYSEQAGLLAAEAVQRALGIGDTVSLCYALALGACPVALWNGETRLASDYVTLLGERAGRHSLLQWQDWARHLRAICDGDPPAAIRSLPLAAGLQAETLYTLMPGLAGPDDYARLGQGVSGWCAPELLRQKALWLQQLGKPAAEVEPLLAEAMALAEGQGALAWELRTAVTRAELWRTQGRGGVAHGMLAAVARRCPPERPGRDQRNAASLLDQLASRA